MAPLLNFIASITDGETGLLVPSRDANAWQMRLIVLSMTGILL
jgi:hypothetical protein